MVIKLSIVVLSVVLAALMQSTEGWHQDPGHGALPVHLGKEKRQVKQGPKTYRTEYKWVPDTPHCKCPQQTVSTITAPPPKVAPGYEYFPGFGYYKFHIGGKTWDQARNICEAEGAYLAIVNSEAEGKVLQELFKRHPTLVGVYFNDIAYIGFHDRFIKKEYVTIQGKSLQSTGFTKWAPNNPDDLGGNEVCGSWFRLGGLNDIPCNLNLSFFCEHEI